MSNLFKLSNAKITLPPVSSNGSNVFNSLQKFQAVITRAKAEVERINQSIEKENAIINQNIDKLNNAEQMDVMEEERFGVPLYTEKMAVQEEQDVADPTIAKREHAEQSDVIDTRDNIDSIQPVAEIVPDQKINVLDEIGTKKKALANAIFSSLDNNVSNYEKAEKIYRDLATFAQKNLGISGLVATFTETSKHYADNKTFAEETKKEYKERIEIVDSQHSL